MSYRLWPAQLTAGSVALALGLVSRIPEPEPAEVAIAAAPFRFTRIALPATSTPPTIDVHPVNPVAHQLARWMSSVGTSVSLGDLDDDGVSNDLCAVEPRTGEVRAAPVPGTGDRYPLFVVAPATPLDPDTYVATGCKFGDFDEDGRTDLLVTYVGRTPLVYLRRPAAALTIDGFVAQDLVPDEPWWTSTVLQTDVDGDGHLDLVVGNYFPDGQQIFGAAATGPVSMHDSFSRARNGGRNRVLLWTGATAGDHPSVRYREIANPFPDDDATAWTLALGAADLDQDGLSDLYVANDFGPDCLYLNRSTPGVVVLERQHGRPTFTTPRSRVLGNDSFKGMGVDFGDLNGDGQLDLFVSNITVHGGLEESHFLYLSTGEPFAGGFAPYVDRGDELGVARSSWSWDTRLVDFDNDTDLELMQATGFLKGDRSLNWWADLAEFANANDLLVSDPRNWPAFPEGIDISGHDPEPFYVRRDDGTYLDVSAAIGFDGDWNARGLAVADVDADGDPDLALANQWEDSWLFRNDTPRTHASLVLWPQLDPDASSVSVDAGPVRSDTTRAAIGATARVTLRDGRALVREVDGGNGHSGANAAELSFGLGTHPGDVALPVALMWRDGTGRVRMADLELIPGTYTLHLPLR
ncbi:MAG: CRTAC1 family protein [Myxococcota bacterium]